MVKHVRGKSKSRVCKWGSELGFKMVGVKACWRYAVSVRHASRLKFYREAGREVTEDLITHVLHGEIYEDLTRLGVAW
ncbi:hypothetical protein PHMEG_0001664 [Phytophthora megakarya]|uniref:Uncharacterized protein n=1 Tax=Phytophthora megakarya TaxID=4795 RepID=A0A225WZY0_9STRA|nr:hypothetical protein PHMEG_0001664 [Phytophthora megakarya]